MTRSQNSFYNLITSSVSSILLIVLNLITRSVFIHYLGMSYLGIEGLFSNILSMLSMAELGFSSAIVYKLYRPIEEQNRQRILALLRLYRQIYLTIGAIVVVAGLCLIPFLPFLVEDYERFAELGLNAVFIFLLYLFKSASTYWLFAHKASFVEANQKSYLLNIIAYASNIGGCIAQILVLVFTKNFILYVLVQILFSAAYYVLCAIICDRRYPFVREKATERISHSEIRGIFKDCSALLLYRASSIIINASDNIVLSATVGLDAVALYSNYLSIKVSLRTLLRSFTNSIQASLGSIYTTGNLEWSRLIVRVGNFLIFFLYGICSIGVAILMDDFITLWIGSAYTVTSWTLNGIVIPTPIALLVAIELYLSGQTVYYGTLRNAMGLFQELKYRPVASVLINLLVCIIAIPKIGIAGCVLSTIIADMTTNLLLDPIIIYRKGLKQSAIAYFGNNILYKLVVVAAGLVCWLLCQQILLDGILGFIVHGCVCVIVSCAFFTLCFFRTKEFRYLVQTAKSLLKKKKHPA